MLFSNKRSITIFFETDKCPVLLWLITYAHPHSSDWMCVSPITVLLLPLWVGVGYAEWGCSATTVLCDRSCWSSCNMSSQLLHLTETIAVLPIELIWDLRSQLRFILTTLQLCCIAALHCPAQKLQYESIACSMTAKINELEMWWRRRHFKCFIFLFPPFNHHSARMTLGSVNHSMTSWKNLMPSW